MGSPLRSSCACLHTAFTAILKRTTRRSKCAPHMHVLVCICSNVRQFHTAESITQLSLSLPALLCFGKPCFGGGGGGVLARQPSKAAANLLSLPGGFWMLAGSHMTLSENPMKNFFPSSSSLEFGPTYGERNHGKPPVLTALLRLPGALHGSQTSEGRLGTCATGRNQELHAAYAEPQGACYDTQPRSSTTAETLRNGQRKTAVVLRTYKTCGPADEPCRGVPKGCGRTCSVAEGGAVLHALTNDTCDIFFDFLAQTKMSWRSLLTSQYSR